MRLINCTTGQLESESNWQGGVPPRYAILSHTWAQNHEPLEVTYDDYLSGKVATGHKNWVKIERSMRITRNGNDKLNYVWIDTCCINKDSSSELSEAINSMFQWYAEAVVCYAHIADFSAADYYASSTELRGHTDSIEFTSLLKGCRWFERGWTLQELVASRRVEFFDSAWHYLGSRQKLRHVIAQITRIDEEVLADISPDQPTSDIQQRLWRVPVARRMSWAARRITTRPEDVAYCLLGIFGVNMPMLYGEGQKAFIRMQEEILKGRNDLTLFAWESEKGGNAQETMRGILAKSPREFANAGDMNFRGSRAFNPEFALSNKGLRITMSRVIHPERGTLFLDLHCQKGHAYQESPCAIELKYHPTEQYVRVNHEALDVLPQQLDETDEADDMDEDGRPIYIATTVERLEEALLSTGPIFLRSLLFEYNKYLTPTGTSHPTLWRKATRSFDLTLHPNFTGYVTFESSRLQSNRVTKFLVGVWIRQSRVDVCVANAQSPLYAAAKRRDWVRMTGLMRSTTTIFFPSSLGGWRGRGVSVEATQEDKARSGKEVYRISVERWKDDQVERSALKVAKVLALVAVTIGSRARD